MQKSVWANIIINSYPMPRQGRLLLLLSFVTCVLGQSLSITMITPDNVSVNMFSSGQYNPNFIQQNAPFNCSMSQIFTYAQSDAQYLSNAPYMIQFSNLSQNIQFTLKSVYKNKFTPTMSVSSCSSVTGSVCKVMVQNNCPDSLGQFNYFSILQLQVQGFPVPFSYYVLCDQSFSTNTFEWGLVIMMVFCLVLIILTVIYSKAWSMGGAGIKINYWLVIAFWIVVTVLGVLAETTSITDPILETIILLAGIAGIWVCSNQLIFLLKINLLQKGVQVKDLFKIRILDVVSLFVGIGTAVGYYFSNKNWIVNDIICVCIMIAAIKILKFTNLKISIFTLIFGLAVQMAFVQYIHFAKGTSYNNLILNNFNYPFELQLPTINEVYQQKCAWLPFTAVLSPGIFMSYLRRFDISRNTNIYLITSICAFILGSIIWMLISVGSVHSWPFQIVTGPTMMGLVAIFAYKRREIRTIWQGSFYDEDFANRDGLLQIMDVINEQNSPKPGQNKQDIELIRNSVMKDLQIRQREDSDMSVMFKKLSISSNSRDIKSIPSKSNPQGN